MTTDPRTLHGGPAFPGDTSTGMTMRDWFAGQVLATFVEKNWDKELTPYVAAVGAYNLADAMLAARKVKQPEPVPDHLAEVYDGDSERATVNGKYEPQDGYESYTWWDHSRLGCDDRSHLPRELYALLKYGRPVTEFRTDYPTRQDAIADLAQAQAQLDAMEDKSYSVIGVAVHGETGFREIAKVYDERNARLIAAAPELYAVCVKLIEAMDDGDRHFTRLCLEAGQLARLALAKVENPENPSS